MVDISSALQRERTALKLMQQLLVDYRDTLPVGQLMPLGAIFDVLAGGADRPFTDKLRDEFEAARRFYTLRVRPYLLGKSKVTEEQVRLLPPTHAFRADDLVIKTLLLAALVPNVPALNGLTATRLAALNHGSIKSMLPNQERAQVAKTLKTAQRGVRRGPAVRQRGRSPRRPRPHRRRHRRDHPRQPPRRRPVGPAPADP